MSLDDLCTRCGFKPFTGCVNGDVITDMKANKATMCSHLKVRLAQDNLKNRLPPEIYGCTAVKSSPLFVPSKVRGEPAIINRTKQNLHIRGLTWFALIPHLKYVFMAMPNLRFKIVNDQRIKEVFVGSESYKSLPLAQRDAGTREINNGIGDIVGGSFDLVIIQLGLLGYKNIAAAGVLKEALMMRVTQSKPTWLFETADRGVVWQHSRDPETEAYVEDHFEDFPMSPGGISQQESESNHLSVEEHGLDDEEEILPPTEQNALVTRDRDEPIQEETPLTGGYDFGSIPGLGEPKKRPWKGGKR
jgi:hypothetical protein